MLVEKGMQSPLSHRPVDDESWIVAELHAHNRQQQTLGARLRKTFRADAVMIYRENAGERVVILHDGCAHKRDFAGLSASQAGGATPRLDTLSVIDAAAAPSDIATSTGHAETGLGILALDVSPLHCLAARMSVLDAQYCVALYRESEAPRFEAADVHTMQRLLPAFRAAFSHREEAAAADENLGRLGLRLDVRDIDYIIDARLFVRWASNRKQAVSTLWVRLVNNRARLEASEPAVQSRLARLVERATSTRSPEGGLILTPQVQILVLPVQSEADGPFAAITLNNFSSAMTETCDLARMLYDLTPAETALCRSLLLGRSVQEHADASNVKISTVRSHLKSLLLKTETMRQGQLISLLFRLSNGPRLTEAS